MDDDNNDDGVIKNWPMITKIRLLRIIKHKYVNCLQYNLSICLSLSLSHSIPLSSPAFLIWTEQFSGCSLCILYKHRKYFSILSSLVKWYESDAGCVGVWVGPIFNRGWMYVVAMVKTRIIFVVHDWAE